MSYYDPPEEKVGFDPLKEFGSIQIRANLFGLHIGENGNERRDIWIDPEELEKIIEFAQFWLPKMRTARIPKCPNCHARFEHRPDEDPHDGEMKAVQKGEATQWHCLCCRKSYSSGPFGHNLYAIKSAEIAEKDYDPFFEDDELP